jgi:uncharacterized membrane protein YqhA
VARSIIKFIDDLLFAARLMAIAVIAATIVMFVLFGFLLVGLWLAAVE